MLLNYVKQIIIKSLIQLSIIFNLPLAKYFYNVNLSFVLIWFLQKPKLDKRRN